MVVFGLVEHDVELVCELREKRLNPLSDLAERLVQRFPVLLIASVRNLKLYMGSLKEIELDFCTDVTSVTDDGAIAIVLLRVCQIADVIDADWRHVIGVDHTRDPANHMEFVAIVIRGLRCAVAEVRGFLNAGLAHLVALSAHQLAHFDRLGVDDEDVLSTVKVFSNPFADLFTQLCRVLAAVIVLPTRNQVWHSAAVLIQFAEQIAFAVDAHVLLGHAQSDDLQVTELRDDTTPGHIAFFIL